MMRVGNVSEKLMVAANQNAHERNYWLNRLAGKLEKTGFPPTHKKTGVNEYHMDTFSFALEKELVLKLLETTNKVDRALHLVLLSGVMLLLNKYTGREDIMIGTPIYKQEIEGDFINTVLVLRNTIKNDISFKDFIAEVRQAILEGTRHQNYPIELLTKELEIEPGTGSTAEGPSLFDVAVLLENIHDKKYLQHLGCNMTFVFKREAESIRGIVEYNSRSYEETSVAAIMAHFEHLLYNALSHAYFPLPHLEMLTGAEKIQLLQEFNRSTVEYPGNKTIMQWFEEQVEKTANHIAVSSPLDLDDIYDQLESLTVNPSQAQKMETLCFKKNSYIYQTPLTLPGEKGDTPLIILKTQRHNSVIVNHQVVQFLDLFDGGRNLQVLYSWVQGLIEVKETGVEFYLYSMPRKDLLEISFEFLPAPEIFPLHRVASRYEEFIRLVKSLYHHHLLELAGVRTRGTAVEIPITNYFAGVKAPGLPVTKLQEILLKKDKELSRARVLILGDTPGTATTGILYLGAYLRRHGIKVYCQFYDPARDFISMKENLEELLKKIQPAVVAVSLKWFLYIARVIDMCEIVKQYSPAIKVVVGGNTASYYWEEIIKYDCIDYLIRGDGEEPLLKICREEAEANIPNCVYKKNQEIIANPFNYIQDETNSVEIYLSHLDEIMLSSQVPRFGTFFIYTQKGCAMNCLYCGGCSRAQQKTFNRKKVLRRGTGEVRKDLLAAQAYASTFHFEFDIQDEHLANYCREIWEGIDLSAHFCTFSTLTPPSAALIELVSQTFKYVYWDFDIGTPSERHRKQLYSLGLVKPQPSDEEILNFLAQCEKYPNLEIRLNLITGMPYFTQEDIEPGAALLAKIMNTYTCFGELHWARLHAQPGASVAETAEKHNMHSYAAGFADFLRYSQENFNETTGYSTVEEFNYPYIYFNDDQLNSRITNFYLENDKKAQQHNKNRQRVLIVDNRLTYQELNERADRLAGALKARGVKPGGIVGIILEPTLEIPVGILGVLKAGCAYMPMDPEFPGGRIQYMLNDSNTKALVTTRSLTEETEKLRHWTGETILLEPGFSPARDEVPSPETIQAAGSLPPAATVTSSSTLTSTGQVSPANLAYVIYTSGTTGKPKGVVLEQRNLVNYVHWFSAAANLTAGDKTVLTSSFAFDLGYTSLYTSLLKGGELHLLSREIYLLAERLLDYIRQKNLTYIKMTPSLFSALVNSPNFSIASCKTLRLAVIGGEAINVEDIEKAHSLNRQLQIMNHYGPTEATIGCVATFVDYERFEEYRLHPVIGKPINNLRIYILDPHQNILPMGVPGELCIAGDGVAPGYLNQPALTAEKFLSASYLSYKSHMSYIYRTGDRARWLPDGTIEFQGRIDNQVKVRGYRIELGEIENRLLKHHQVQEAVVVVKEVLAIEGAAEKEDKFLCAYIVPKGGTVAPTTGSTAGAEKLLTLKEIREKENFATPPDDYPPFKKEELNQSIIARFKKKVKEYPGKVAIKSNGGSLTYESLENYSIRAARKILEEYDDRCQLSKSERVRYKRQMLLYEWGMESQEKLKGTRVFVAGAGGGASPTIMQLALAGFGTIYVCDCDVVELSNLNRQFLHDESRIGMNKAISTQMTIERINSNVKVIPITQKLTSENVFQLVGDAEIIFDMFDGQQDKFVLSRCAAVKNIPHIIAAMTDINAYTAIFHPPKTPCFHCLFDKKKFDEIIEGMSHLVKKYEKNPLPVVATSLFMSTAFAVNEAIKYILGFENLAHNKFIFFNQRGTERLAATESYRAMTYTFSDHFRRICKEQGFDWDIGWRGNLVEELKVEPDPDCPVCRANVGEKPRPEAIPLRIDSDTEKTRNAEKDKQQTVALLLNHDIEMAVGILGALKSNKIYLLLEPHYPMERLIHILKASEARIILTDNQHREMAEKLRDKVNKNIKLININDIKESKETEKIFTLEISPDKAAYWLVSPGTKPEENEFIEESHKNVLEFVRAYTYNLSTQSTPELDPVSSPVFYTAMMDLYAALLNGTDPYIFTSRHRPIPNQQAIGPGILANEWREFLLEELPRYMIPSHFVLVDHIPLTPNGKVDRKALPEPGVDKGDDSAPVPPRNEIEKKLVQIWSEVLGIEKENIGINTNFFQLGGHSLNATAMVGKIYKELNIKMPLAEVFKVPTIKGLAGYIESTKINLYISLDSTEKREYYPLSSAQRRIYIFQHLDLNSAAFNMPHFIELKEEAPGEELETIFRELIKRHDSLRAFFQVVDGEPMQRIMDETEFKIHYYSLSDTKSTLGDKENEMTRTQGVVEVNVKGGKPGLEKIINDFIRPFDLARAPLLRVGLVKLEEKNHLLMVDMHHIISDGTSQLILTREFIALYDGKKLPPLRLQYKDYSRWQNNQMESSAIVQQETYWLKEFEGKIPVLNLPIDYERPEILSFMGDFIPFDIDPEETGLLMKAAQEEGVTLYMLILAIYTIFLSKICHQEDIIVGTPSAGRRHPDLQGIIGMFVNVLAMRNSPQGTKTFREFLLEVKEKTLTAFENQDYQYDQLVEKLGLTRTSARTPLVEAQFIWQNVIGEAERPNALLETFKIKNTRLETALVAMQIGEKIEFQLHYMKDLFKKNTMEKFSRYILNILKMVIKKPQIELDEIELLPGEQKIRIAAQTQENQEIFNKYKEIDFNEDF